MCVCACVVRSEGPPFRGRARARVVRSQGPPVHDHVCVCDCVCVHACVRVVCIRPVLFPLKAVAIGAQAPGKQTSSPTQRREVHAIACRPCGSPAWACGGQSVMPAAWDRPSSATRASCSAPGVRRPCCVCSFICVCVCVC